MRILYVEDDPTDADLTQRQLRRSAPHFQLETVATMAAALARLQRLETEPLELVLTDVALPDGDGLTLLAFIRERALPVAVVVITGAGDEDTAAAALKSGAEDYVVKRKDYLERLPGTLTSSLQRYRAQAARRARSFKVLYADYCPVDIDLTRRHFARHAPNFQFQVVGTGPEVARLLRPTGPNGYDAVLLDYRLPAVNPLELLKELRQPEKRDVPVVLLIGPGAEEFALQAIKLGASSYVVKNPGYLHQLPGELENAVSRAESTRREKALRERRRRYQLATSAGSVGVWDWHLKTNRIYLDSSLKALLGWKDDEINNYLDDWGVLVHPEDAPRVTERARSYLSGAIPNYEIEHRASHKDGRVRWFLTRGTVLRDEEGTVYRLIGTSTDITEKRKAEEALRDSQKRYELATAAGGVGVWDWNLETSEIYLDPELKAILGFQDLEIRNQIDDWTQHLHPEDKNVTLTRVQAHLDGQTTYFEDEHRMMHKDGSVRWFLARGTAVRNEGGRVVRMVGTDTDITERKRAEEAAQVTQELLQSTIDALDTHIVILDEKARIIAVNDPWLRFTKSNGYQGADGGLGRTYAEVCESSIRREDKEPVLEGIRAVINGERKDFRFVYQSCHESEEIWFQLRVNRFYSRGILRLVLTHENITEIEQAYDALRQLTRRLLQSQDEERRRIARELHDSTVQNLGALIANLAFLRKRAGPLEAQTEMRISESVSLCEQVIKEIRTLSYLLHPPLLDEVGLASALQWYVRGFNQRSGIQVEVTVVPDVGRLPSEVEMALFRVVQESLTNIHRHSGSTNASIRLTKEGDEVLVQVKDRGRGMRFEAASGAGNTIESLGVGILGMRERLRQLGGRLEIESTYGGTTVTAVVPFARRTYAANTAGG